MAQTSAGGDKESGEAKGKGQTAEPHAPGQEPRVLGVDLSLTATGIATAAPTHHHTDTLHPPSGLYGRARIRWVRDHVLAWAGETDLVVVEGPSYGSTGRGQHERAGLWWIVTSALERAGHRTAVLPPTSLKRYATGKGNAGKDQVLTAAVRRIIGFDGDNNAADAAWLAYAGLDQLTAGAHSLVPQAHRLALSGGDWPEQVAS